MAINIDNKLDKLKNIMRVDAPAFLFTRIKERIESMGDAPVSTQWKLAFVFAAVLILALNTGIVFQSPGKEKKNNITDMVNAMQLSPSNDFYHD
jgi:hypothetical protein